MAVRTRFAPSPTGFMHVGGIRTALFAWLVARQDKEGGRFYLRIEDTDKSREVADADKRIIESLKALGLNFDGEPYYQSQHLDKYKEWAQKLIDKGRAYADPYSAEEVQAFRDQATKEKRPFLYRDHRPDNPPAWDGTKPLRFKSEPKACQWHDEVMGELKTGPEVIDDFILIKTDGYPTYNFAHIIDDAEMEISHIIRGQEFLPSIPNYLNLYEALELNPPIMATMPHVLAPGGKRKLSKRDGAKDILEYLDEGYLSEALISFIATLGWNDGTEQEFFSVSELIEKFSLERVQKSGAHFDEERLKWINGHFIRQLNIDSLKEKTKSYWPKPAQDYDDAYKLKVLALVQERLKYLAELPELTNFFFEDLPVNSGLINNHKQLGKIGKDSLHKMLEVSQQKLKTLEKWEANEIQNTLNLLLAELEQKPVVLFSLIRIASTQAPASPGLAETLAVLGKETTLRRIQNQITAL